MGDKTFGRLLKAALEYPSDFQFMCEELFAKMNTGGLSIVGRIPYFNGGIFTDSEAPSLDRYGIQQLLDAYTQDWKNIEPSIFGSLFEGAIDPERRSQLGAHYTPASDILDVIEPVIIEPLRAEWNAIREEIEPAIQAFYAQYHSDEGLFAAHNLKEQQAEIKSKITGFLDRLASIKVLDPACGSGNFLYLTQQRLIEFESEVRAKLEPVNDGLPVPTRIHPSQFHGIDLNEYSPEITNMVLWIGFIQARKALNEPVVVGDVGVPGREPILKDLTTIQHHDALLDEGEPDGKYKWPKVDFIVGNPPFLGNHKMREKLSDAYVEKLRATYEDLVGGRSDLVCFWFAQAYEMVKAGTTQRVGLIATNSIRQTSNRNVLARIKESGDIFLAWPDRPWIQDGASVQVSIVCFDNGTESNKRILTFKGSTGEKVLTQVDSISVDLRPDIDLATARVIPEQVNLVYKGMEPAGPFDIPKELAASWLDLPNPSGVKNQDVLKPYLKGDDITGKPVGHWIIDFNDMTLEEARKYKAPFAYAQEHVKPLRDTNRNAGRREMWWQFGRPRPALRAAVASFQRYLVTPRVAKYRTYSWASIDSIPSNALAVIAKEDNFTYGVLNSKIHAVWAHHVGSSLEDRPQFTNLCIESFPFPQCNDAMRAQIEEAARYLDQMRTFIKDKSGLSLTGIYNALEDFVAKGATQEKHQGLSQLLQAENELDGLVAQAYGWSWPLSEFEILTNLLELNLALTDPVGPTV
ncbi:class I SAM-dependent DNA methyltransferase [Deinococcus misasensis]|uniref:class I SAM-dependent DNA methyltransferase n=1 Tax=Deinococcus misasensis TaxID=392413 RepID=UPI0012FAAD4E|nr:DNA methyltransferase [Deinococcus misasensis]